MADQFVKLVPDFYDAVTDCTYSGSNMTSCKFRIKGNSTSTDPTTWTLVSTLTMTYDGSNNMLTAVRS